MVPTNYEQRSDDRPSLHLGPQFRFNPNWLKLIIPLALLLWLATGMIYLSQDVAGQVPVLAVAFCYYISCLDGFIILVLGEVTQRLYILEAGEIFAVRVAFLCSLTQTHHGREALQVEKNVGQGEGGVVGEGISRVEGQELAKH